MNLVEELRNKVSRDNRELLDRAANEIEDLDRNLVAAYKKIEELKRDRAGDGALEVCEYIKRSDVEALIKDFCKGLIEKKRDYVEVTEFNADIQKKLKGLPGVEMPIYTHFMGKPISEVVELIKANDEGRFIAVPCKVGDVVYQVVDRIYSSTVRTVIYDTDNFGFDERAIGKSVFLSEDEALAEMKRRGDNDL